MKSKYGNEPISCEIDGKPYKFKSKAEWRYSLYLEFLRKNGDILEWYYEPQVFSWLNQRGNTVEYKPDFKVIEKTGKDPSGLIECRRSYHEVKGFMDARSKAKLKGFAKHYPTEKLVLIDSAWFKRNTKKLKGLVPGWV